MFFVPILVVFEEEDESEGATLVHSPCKHHLGDPNGGVDSASSFQARLDLLVSPGNNNHSLTKPSCHSHHKHLHSVLLYTASIDSPFIPETDPVYH